MNLNEEGYREYIEQEKEEGWSPMKQKHLKSSGKEKVFIGEVLALCGPTN